MPVHVCTYQVWLVMVPPMVSQVSKPQHMRECHRQPFQWLPLSATLFCFLTVAQSWVFSVFNKVRKLEMNGNIQNTTRKPGTTSGRIILPEVVFVSNIYSGRTRQPAPLLHIHTYTTATYTYIVHSSVCGEKEQTQDPMLIIQQCYVYIQFSVGTS